MLPVLLRWDQCLSSQVGVATPSHGGEEELTPEGGEAPVSLEDAYRGIMAGVGLSGSALEAWLEEWMKLISADMTEMAQGGIASTIPGSRAAELLVEMRLGRTVAAIGGKCRPHVGLPVLLPCAVLSKGVGTCQETPACCTVQASVTEYRMVQSTSIHDD